MRIEVTKGIRDDIICITRDDGSMAETRFPKKGPFPHDLVHAVVEDQLGFRHAFWGMIASGRHSEDIQAIADALGHASAGKAHIPDPSIVELIQAERLVECFEAEIWNGPAALEDLQSVADAAFAQSLVPRVELTAESVSEIRRRLDALRAQWRETPTGGALTSDWSG
ncbi:MAG: hypothetical protein R3C13_08860 [Hyphomonas sp.]|uniref:hypothetical protein n=1 Tax=Hyphomonas sp. TaxID=87 RepID=UPI003526C4F5